MHDPDIPQPNENLFVVAWDICKAPRMVQPQKNCQQEQINQWLIGGLGWWFGILESRDTHKQQFLSFSGILEIQTTAPQTTNPNHYSSWTK